MPTASDVRAWAAAQEPPLAKPVARGRLSTAAQEAYNAAHPDNPYVMVKNEQKAPTARLSSENASGGVEAIATHDGTPENPSSSVDAVSAARLAHPSNPFYNPTQDNDYSDGSNYRPEETPNVHYVNFAVERFSEAP